MPTFCTEQDVRDVDFGNVLGDFTDGQINTAIDCAELYIDEDAWEVGHPGRAVKGCAFLAAHIAVMLSAPDSPAGPVTGEAAGGLSRSYGAVSGALSESALASTSFGLMYLELRRLVPSTPLTLC